MAEKLKPKRVGGLTKPDPAGVTADSPWREPAKRATQTRKAATKALMDPFTDNSRLHRVIDYQGSEERRYTELAEREERKRLKGPHTARSTRGRR